MIKTGYGKHTDEARKIMQKIDDCEIKNPARRELMFLLKLILNMSYLPIKLKQLKKEII